MHADPAVYPYLTIYPAVANAVEKRSVRSVRAIPVALPLSSGYPEFNICEVQLSFTSPHRNVELFYRSVRRVSVVGV